LIPELFPKIDKAIYMDIDIIVNCDIKELWNLPLTPSKRGRAVKFCFWAESPVSLAQGNALRLLKTSLSQP
jgi:lipopolysaccharide biosynthesis glycosyltransferase